MEDDHNDDLKESIDLESKEIIDHETLSPDNYSVLAENMLENESGHDGDEIEESSLERPVPDVVDDKSVEKVDRKCFVFF